MPEPTSGAPRRVIACLILLAIGTGCASVSPWNQDFVEVVTPNFRVTSSFGEAATRSLALELETLHAGTLYALGLSPDGRLPNRTRVVAFDDRGFGRPFAIRGEPASWIPSVDAPILMIRAPGSFAERLTADLRHRYARRVLRALSRERPPLWYAEGRAYLASTIRVSGTIAEIGRLHPEHARAIVEWKRSDLADVFDVTRLDDRSRASRAEFEAASWALVHTILFDAPQKQAGRRALERVRVGFESGRTGPLADAIEKLGSRRALAERVWTHLGSGKHRVDRVQIAGLEPGEIASRTLSPREAHVALAELALDLDRPALALEYFDRARQEAPGDAPSSRPDVEAGRALALLRLGRAAEARDAHVERRPDASVAARAAEIELELARASRDAVERQGHFDLALAHLREAETAEGARAARVWLALARLIDGEIPTGQGDTLTAARCLELARAARTGALEIDLVDAELRAAEGRKRAAAFAAREVVSRSHDPMLRKRARRYLESAD